MADGVGYTAGSGTTILTDDCGASGHAQVIKLAYSADGTATHVTADADGVLVNLGANNDVTLPNGLLDSFGNLVSGSVQNQIDIQFYQTDGSVGDLVTETNANGGTATATGGMATFAATTAASSQAKGVTPTSTKYTAGAEVYTIFTAAFTGTGSGTSYHRIGLYDTNNGFFIGYEGGTFGATVRKATADTQTAKGSWSDPLTGGASSKFTRGGTPEAIDLTKLNVFKIRFGWVGSAPIKFEVLSPDGAWVTFHEVKQPNLAALPSIDTAELPVTCDVNSGNSGAALSILTNCWCAGTTQSLGRLDAELTDTSYGQLVRSVITGVTTGGGGSYVNVKVTPSGAIVTDSAVSSIAAGDENIGNVDIVTVPAPLSTTGGGTQATALRVTIASDSTGFVGVWDGSDTIDIEAIGADGKGNALNQLVTAGFGYVFNETTWDRLRGDATNGMLVNLGSNNDVTVSGTVTANAGSGTFTVGGTVTANLAAGTNTNEVVGDAAHDAAAAGNPVLIAGVAQAHDDTAPPNRVSAESDATRLATDFDGSVFVRPHGPQVWSYHLNTSTAQTDTSVHAAPGAGLSLYVGTIVFSSGAATAINAFFEEGASTVLGPFYLEAIAGRGMAVTFNPPKKITANTALTLTTSASIAHSVEVTGFTAQG